MDTKTTVLLAVLGAEIVYIIISYVFCLIYMLCKEKQAHDKWMEKKLK